MLVNMCFETHTSVLIANTTQRLDSTIIDNGHKNRRTPILCTRASPLALTPFWVGLRLAHTRPLLWSSKPAGATASYVGVIPRQSWFVWPAELCITFTLTAEIYCSSCDGDEWTHTRVCTQAERPMDISWHLHKLPAPRGIYIPRLLSIIRHLSFFSHSFTRLPVPTARKSWLVSQCLDRERSRWRYREGQM